MRRLLDTLSSGRLSIGAKLAFRYTAAMSVTLTVVALFVLTRVEHRINREATLLLEVQANELAEEIASERERLGPAEFSTWLADRIERSVRAADPSLKLGIEFDSESGERVLAAGSLAEIELPLSGELLDGEADSLLRAVNMDDEFAFLSMAVRVPGGFVRVVMNTARYADNVDHIRDVFLLSLPLVLVLSAVGGWVLARGSLRPISQITRRARRISGANLDENLPLVGSGDELDQLAATLNDMLARIRDSVERMRRFNANAAHELRTPLTALSSEAEVTLEQPREPDEYRRVLTDIAGRVRSLAAGVDGMLRLARSEAGLAEERRERVELGAVLETVYDFFAPLAEESGVELRLVNVPDATVLGDASWLQQLFSNLLSNALKFTPEGGRVEVGGWCEGGSVRVRVSDTGCGIPEEKLGRIFDRYERASAAAAGEFAPAGFGLGLAIAREIARAHSGGVSVTSTEGSGTTFTVELPLAEAGRA